MSKDLSKIAHGTILGVACDSLVVSRYQGERAARGVSERVRGNHTWRGMNSRGAVLIALALAAWSGAIVGAFVAAAVTLAIALDRRPSDRRKDRLER